MTDRAPRSRPRRPAAGGPRNATLQTVAAAAGVHVSTAARALDPAQRHRLTDEVVARVRLVAEQQGYRRDVTAAALRTGRSRLIGVVLPDLANLVFAPILSGISSHLASEGYAVLVGDGAGSGTERLRIIETLIARRVDGLILATATRDDPVISHCIAANVPTVLVNRAEDRARVPAVITDDRAGITLAVDHLVALGHRRIGHLAGPDGVSTGHLRRQGFDAAMRAHGLDPTAVATAGAYTRAEGEAASATLLDRAPDLTALVASNDLLALGAYRTCHRRGLVCPRDLSIIGHNDMPLVDMVDPPLTTISIGHEAMGREAARLIVALIGRPAPDAAVPVLRADARLVLRRSTAPPREPIATQA